MCPKKNSTVHDTLETLLGLLGTVFPGEAPRIEPHVTISSNIALDMDNAADEVLRILLSCSAAVQLLPKDRPWVRLGRVASQRGFFTKLYMQCVPEAALLLFARIVREMFVIMPQKTEAEHRVHNSHLFQKDSHGQLVRRKSRKNHQEPVKEIDIGRVRLELAAEAAVWVQNEYRPHVLLVYLDLYPVDKALWHTIRLRVLDYVGIENCDSGAWDDGNGLAWSGGVLKLVLCEGDVLDWVVLGQVDV